MCRWNVQDISPHLNTLEDPRMFYSTLQGWEICANELWVAFSCGANTPITRFTTPNCSHTPDYRRFPSLSDSAAHRSGVGVPVNFLSNRERQPKHCRLLKTQARASLAKKMHFPSKAWAWDRIQLILEVSGAQGWKWTYFQSPEVPYHSLANFKYPF